MDQLTDNDKQRIEQFAREHGESFKTGEWFENLRIESCKVGAEYATIYERGQHDIIMKAIYDNAQAPDLLAKVSWQEKEIERLNDLVARLEYKLENGIDYGKY